MKKHILFGGMLLIAAAFTGCTEDFKDWASPQSNGPEDAITIPGFSATAVAVQNLATEADEVSLFSLSNALLPEGYTLGNARIELTPQGIDDPNTIILNTSLTGLASVETLQELVVETYGKRPDERTFNGHVKVNALKDGQAIYIDAGTIPVKLIPEAPYIAQNYYIVGGTKDWAGSAASKEQKFSHSDADVYDDPIFTIVIDGTPDGDTWFAIGDDTGCDAITNDNDWSKIMGIVGGDNKATEGLLDYRYNMGADNSFCVSNARKIKITINMMEYTFTVTPVNIADNYYLIGGPGNWDSSKEQKFSHSNKDVFDDPVFTYVFESTGGDMWFAFGDDEAIDAVGENVWNKLFGTTGASEDMSGSFDRRYNLDGDHSFHLDGSAKYYRFSVNMMTMTYEITPLNFGEFFYEIGNESGWSTSHPLYGTNSDGTYQGYYWLDGEYKFKPNADNWNDDLEYVDGTTTGGTLTDGGGPNCPDPGAGFYQINLDVVAMTYSLMKIESISMIGGFNGWGDDLEMTYNKDEGCWEVTTDAVSGEFKFRANHDWGINWGGAEDNLVQDGSNLNIEAGTYKFQLYITYAGNNKVVITKQ